MPANTPKRQAVALVNNERRLRDALADALRHHGISTAIFDNGADLLGDCRLPAYRLIVADWTNSPLNGRDLWAALTQNGLASRLVFLSPHADLIGTIFAGAVERPLDIIDLPTPINTVALRLIQLLNRT